MAIDKQIFVSSSYLKTAQLALAGLEKFVDALNDEYIDIEAWSIFHVWLDGRPQKDVPYYPAFRMWQLFHWQPAAETVPLPIDRKCKTIAEAYLKLKGESLPPEHAKILKSAVKNHPDIYEVCMFNGDLVSALGCINQKKIIIYAPELSRKGKSGDYLMAQAIPATKECFILLGASHFLSRRSKPLVQQFCDLAQRCEKSGPAFESLQSDFFNLFYDLVKSAAVEN